MEFAPDLTSGFSCWISSSGVKTFEKFCDLVFVEQFHRDIIVPDDVAATIKNSRSQWGCSPDESVNTHTHIFDEPFQTIQFQETGSLSP